MAVAALRPEKQIQNNGMKRYLFALAIGAALSTGCATAHKSYQTYQTSAVIVPAAQPHQYNAEFRISSCQTNLLLGLPANPSLLLTAGVEGQVKICDATEMYGIFSNGILCTALVTERGDQVEAKTKIVVRTAGKDVLDSSQTFVVAR
jgi:hypothetical protein